MDCKPQSEMMEKLMMFVHGAKMLQNSCNMASNRCGMSKKGCKTLLIVAEPERCCHQLQLKP